MSDLSIPGITKSKYKTDTIIGGLVKAKEIQLNQMEEDHDQFELKRNVWQSINILTNKLEDSSRTLYNIDNPFRQKFSSSSDENVLTVSNNRQAENGEYTVRVLQVAQTDSLRSNEINNDYMVPSGEYTFGSGENTKSFTFSGGVLQQFISIANRQLRGIAQFHIIKNRGSNRVLVFSAVKSGAEHRLQFKDLGKEFAVKTGLILDADSLRLDLLKTTLIKPFNKLSNYKLSETENKVNIGPGQELRISLPNNYTVRSGGVMRYEIEIPSEKLPLISNTPDNVPNKPKKEGPQLPEDFGVKNRSRFSSRDASKIPPPPYAELDDIRIDSAGSDSAFIHITPDDLPPAEDSAPAPLKQRTKKNKSEPDEQPINLFNPVANFYFVQQDRRIAAGPKEGEVQISTIAHEEILALDSIDKLRNIDEVIIRNPNPDKNIVLRDLRFENTEIKDGYLGAHPIRMAQNAKISYLGVETERANNNIDDLLPGLTLQVKKAKPDEDIIIRTEPDYETIIQKVAEFITSYNDLMTQVNVVSSTNDNIIREKTSFTEKQEEEARKVLGLMRSDSSIINLKYRLISSVSDGYPTELGTRVLSDVGISGNLSGFQGGIDQSKLRGYLEFDTEIFRQAMEDNFIMVQDLFGRDNDGDFIIDSGSSLEVQKISSSYTQPNGPIPYRVKDLERNIQDSERRIADYKDYLKDYESGLKRKYGQMEGALNQLEQQQRSLQNFSDSMNR